MACQFLKCFISSEKIFSASSSIMHEIGLDYFPSGFFSPIDVTGVSWAHAVNSRADLESNLQDEGIRMLEADLVMGKLVGSEEPSPAIVIMAHPPATESDLSFEMFLNQVIQFNKNLPLEKRKGIKLDFKEYEAAEKSLEILAEKNEYDPSQLQFPVWINADILPGPVNASMNKVDGKSLIEMQRTKFSQGTLSLGWTTRFGVQNNGEVINEGSYTKTQIVDMSQLIKESFPLESRDLVQITFPVRAAIALNSTEMMKYLLDESGISFASPSLTLWESASDPRITAEQLQQFITAINASRVFVDLPQSSSFIKESSEEEL